MTDNEPEGGDVPALDKLRVRGVRSIGHRVRTPISVVVSSMQAVSHRDDLPDEARKHLDVALDQMRRVTDDLEMLTDLGAWTDGMARPLQLGALVEDVARNRLAATTWEGVDYEFVIDDSLEVTVDEPTVRWAIDATVREAVRRLEDGGTVVIATADDPTGGSVETTVETVPRSGAPGVDLPSVELDLVQEIVELHGGTVTDVFDGVRSGVRLRLPAGGGPVRHQPGRETATAVTSVPASQPNAPGKAQIIGANGGPLVLIVEDDAALVDHLERTLSIDHRVVAVASADEAAALIGQLRPDAVVCDITLRGGRSGEQFVHDLHEDPEFRDLPVLILTGHTDDDLRMRLLRDGADDYLVKPFAVGELRVRLDNLIEARLDTEALRARAERAHVLAEQLQHALDSRVIIEQAKAFVASDRGIDVTAAFEILRAYSRSNSLKLHAVARAVVEDGFRP